MIENPYKNHDLYKLSKRYKQIYEKRKQEITDEDIKLKNQIVIIRTQPPILAQPKEWPRGMWKAPLRAETFDGKRIKIDNLDLIENCLIRRFLTENDQALLARYLVPPK